MKELNKALIELKNMLSDAMITQIDLDLKIKLVCKLNEALSIANVVGRSEQLFCEICELQKVEENGDWCDKCLEDANWSTS